jgi:hypothetical protein
MVYGAMLQLRRRIRRGMLWSTAPASPISRLCRVTTRGTRRPTRLHAYARASSHTRSFHSSRSVCILTHPRAPSIRFAT